MSILALAVLAIVAAFLALTVRQQKPELAVIIGLAASVFIFVAIIDKLTPTVEMFTRLMNMTSAPTEFVGVILKAIGITIIVQIASDTCRDAGENSLASKIEIAGKFTILFLSLPLLSSVLEIALDLIGVNI